MADKYRCPCCGYYTFEEEPNGNYDICKVCFWEDDPIAYDDPNYEGSCNHVSLNQARQNFITYGACVEEMIRHVRPPFDSELQGIDW